MKYTQNVPLRWCVPEENNSGCCKGSCIVSKIAFLASIKPPTSSHLTFGIFGVPKLLECCSCMWWIAFSKSSAVTEMPAAHISNSSCCGDISVFDRRVLLELYDNEVWEGRDYMWIISYRLGFSRDFWDASISSSTRCNAVQPAISTIVIKSLGVT